MTKKDIKAGDIVLLKDGRRCIVMPDIDDSNNGLALYGVLKICPSFLPDFSKRIGIITHLDYYDDDLTHLDGYIGYTIMAFRDNPIAAASCLFEILTNDTTDKNCYYESRYYWDWKREEVKEVTMADVEEKFGCKVKIVKEESDE